MSWGKLLQPDLVLGQPILGLSRDVIVQNQLQGLVLDVDETLVPTSMTESTDELKSWVKTMRQHTQIWLVSNNLSQSRIGRIADSLELPYLFGASKPSRRKIRQAVEAMELPIEQVAMVGDRLFTDVLAGNRLGMFTILVEPMIDPGQEARKHPIRSFEVWISQKLGATLTEVSDL